MRTLNTHTVLHAHKVLTGYISRPSGPLCLGWSLSLHVILPESRCHWLAIWCNSLTTSRSIRDVPRPQTCDIGDRPSFSTLSADKSGREQSEGTPLAWEMKLMREQFAPVIYRFGSNLLIVSWDAASRNRPQRPVVFQAWNLWRTLSKIYLSFSPLSWNWHDDLWSIQTSGNRHATKVTWS